MQETELYEPIREYLDCHGYEVNAEVMHCDIVATRDDDLIVVELKTSATMQLLIQATDRQKITKSVYVAIPHPGRNRRFKGIQRVIRQLELGLLVVTSSPLGLRVTKVFDPLPSHRKLYKRNRRAIIQEISDRTANYNIGGSNRTGLVTAYREKAIFIATCLKYLGASSPKILREYGTGKSTQGILANNHYGWFQRIDRGIYQITEQGKHDLLNYPELYAQSKKIFDCKQKAEKRNTPA